MEHAEAVALIRDGVRTRGGVWADLGAGSGVFTRALSELLGPEGTVYALDRRAALAPRAVPDGAAILTLRADFTEPLGLADLDGVVMANALHFARQQEQVLAEVARCLKPGGSFVLVEYDLARGSRWIPFPVPLERFRALASRSGLSEPLEIGRRASRYGPRDLYAVAAVRL